MPKALSEAQIESFRRDGYLFPVDGIDPAEAALMVEDLDRFETEQGFSAGEMNIKGALCLRRSYEISKMPAILDVVEDLIGPDILVFAARFWIKPPRDGSFVSWHQDSAYLGLDPHELVGVWLALTDSNEDNGCMFVLPRSHRGAAFSHVETFADKNMLSRGQTITDIDESKTVAMRLKVGQFSCHHERMVHGSHENRSEGTRIGLCLFYIPAHVRSTVDRRTAYLVRGEDRYGHWDPDPAPRASIDTDIIAHIKSANARYVDPQFRQETDTS